MPSPPIADPGERQRRFEAVYAAHRGPILGYVLRRTSNPDDAAARVRPPPTAPPADY